VVLSLLKYCKERDIFNISKAKEKGRYRWGCVKVYRRLWDRFGLDKILSMISKERKVRFDYFSAIFLMIVDRLTEPKSKLKSYEEQDRYYGIARSDLHHLYRALDILAEGKEKIEEFLFERNKNLFNIKVNVVLYDVTTLYFESVKVDSMRDFGFSKDCKINEVQVVIGLIVDLEGQPIGFDIFPGNTYEGHTLKKVIERLENRFKIQRLIFIADQAMLSKENLDIIRNSGYEYVVGSRIKNKGKRIKEEILNINDYTKVSYKDYDNEDVDDLRYKVINLNEDKLIAIWSKKRAEKDAKDRQRLIERAQEMIKKGANRVVSKRGALKYIDIKMEQLPRLNKDKINQDALWDGFYGIQTNCKDMSFYNLMKFYHDLWKIEESFRIFKSHLEMRPVFHWTPRRIKGHLVLCFIAFLLERTLELELKRANILYSPERVRNALEELQFSEVIIEGKVFYLRSNIRGLANKILRCLKIKIPPTISTPDKFF
jgi:transposase